MPTIFSRIVSGEIPSVKIYEDAQTYAFLDIGPASRGHTLVICKAEYADLFSIPADVLMAVQQSVQLVARAIHRTLQPDGINIIQNNGAAAGQTVFHYHVHIIPRWEGDQAFTFWKPGQASPAELQAIAAQISAALA
jgi:histidine triad (HIT) family protein